MRLRLLLPLSAIGLATMACGLSVVGDATADDPPGVDDVDDVDGDDAAAPPGEPPPHPDGSTPEGGPQDCEPEPCALPAADSGFELVLFGDTAAPCPADFATADVVTNPVAGDGACACGDCSASVNCSMGVLATAYGGPKCENNGLPLQANNGACSTLPMGHQWGKHGSVTPPAAVVGECSAAPVATPSAVTTTARRICTPSATTCRAAACTPPAGFSACIVHDGDIACPAHAPNKHVVGTDVSLTCAACQCKVEATCTGTLETFEAAACAGTPLSVPANMCTKTDGANVTSYKWTGTVAERTCRTSPAPPPTLTLTDQRTVCCP